MIWFDTHTSKKTRSNRILLRPCVANKTDLIENECSDDAKHVWMKSHQKKTTKSKNKNTKRTPSKPGVWQVFIILGFPSLFFSCVLWFCIFKTLYSWCCSAQKPGIQKGSTQTPYSHFWLERKRRVKNVWKEGGTGPPLLRIHFLNLWFRYD